ncbi:MAG: rRNA pseudouridine synthase [Candidatus Acididesulfobacter guangdongensis]|uniref:Pseudouridine synthase n=1 Tax=Acididesulfobacter guangdongensis TaxID=2597225 RepID=A0A519BFV4_ACIG2|nr:MAG: rRNA pseudouridine synthase [Candidatus Acididesulfobacter guangdongensis]
MKSYNNDNMKQGVRLNKFIAMHTGVSRRAADEIIREGRANVNGKKISQLATNVSGEDIVLLDEKRIGASGKDFIYLMINKPKAFLSSRKSEKGFRTVMDLIDKPEIAKFVFPVGRLDFMSEGLLLMTNDGDFAYKVTHPKFNVIKSYIVEVKGDITPEIFSKIKKGVFLKDDGLLKPHSVKVVKKNLNKYILLIDLKNGKNREIRKILEFLNLEIILLRRIKVGGLPIGDLRSGEFKIIKKNVAELVFKKETETVNTAEPKQRKAASGLISASSTSVNAKNKIYYKNPEEFKNGKKFQNKYKDGYKEGNKNSRSNISGDKEKKRGEIILKNNMHTKHTDEKGKITIGAFKKSALRTNNARTNK